MRIRMTRPNLSKKVEEREVSDSLGLRMVSQGQALALPPLPKGGKVSEAAVPMVHGDTAPERVEPPAPELFEAEPPEEAKPISPKRGKGGKGGAKDGA